MPSYEGIKMMIFDAHIDVKILQKLYPEEFAADPAFALDWTVVFTTTKIEWLNLKTLSITMRSNLLNK